MASLNISPTLGGPALDARRAEFLPENREALASIVATLRSNRRFRVVTHLRPDGDALGSALGMAQLLRELGAELEVITLGPLGDNFDFLPAIGEIRTEPSVDFAPEVTIYIDCGDWTRADSRDHRTGIVINIDHHLGNPNFGHINYVDPKAAAAGEQLFHVVHEGGFHLSRPLALCIHTAIVCDTGNFKFGNTRPHVYEIATLCTLTGVDPSEVASLVFERRKPGAMILTGRILGRIAFECGGRLAWSEVRQTDYAEVGGEANEPDGLVGDLRSIRGVDMAILIHEMADGGLRASLRSRGDVNCQQVAVSLGGGGHKNASGLVMPGGPYEDARQRLLDAARTCLNG